MLCAGASAFLGTSQAPASALRPRAVAPRSSPMVMSTAEKTTESVSLSSGGGMFTSSSPEVRRVGAAECAPGVLSPGG